MWIKEYETLVALDKPEIVLRLLDNKNWQDGPTFIFVVLNL
jgi:hypothetical protein